MSVRGIIASEKEGERIEAEIHYDIYIYALYVHVFDIHMCVICT